MKPHTTHHDDCGCLSEKHRAEIDALRARVAEVEKERDAILMQARSWASEAKTQRATVNEVGSALGGIPDWGPIVAAVNARLAALAASQAEVRELREALRLNVEFIKNRLAGRIDESLAGKAGEVAGAALSRPPGDDTALREMLGRAINEAWWGKAYPDEANESSAMLRSHIVNRILGQPGDDAAPTKEE